MQTTTIQPAPREIAILLFDRFSNHCLANAVEPFRAANMLSRKELYRWQFVTWDGRDVVSSSGLPVTPGARLADHPGGDYLFLLPSYGYAGETEGGRLFVQDLGLERVFYEATWENLTRCERRDLSFFFGKDGTAKRLRRFQMSVQGNTNLAFLIGTGQGFNTAQDINTGTLVVPQTASFGDVRLEQSEVSFVATPRDRYTTTLRFRLLSLTEAC